MDIPKNARLSLRGREALARFVVEQGATRKAAAAAFRVGAKTVAKWVARYQAGGVGGLYDRSSRPHRSPRRLALSVAERG
jgi:transposase